jgi:hypothetical protein
MKKSESQRRHADRRAWERLGHGLSDWRHKDWVQQIQSEIGLFLRKQSLRISVWAVREDNEYIAVVYDKKRKTIVTVLGKVEEGVVDELKRSSRGS